MGSVWGKCVKLSLFGESHGPGIGVVLDGLPHGFALDLNAVSAEMQRRRATGALATPRAEADMPEILSGLLNNVTTGAPLCALIRNQDARSGDYEGLREVPRPGHADYTAFVRYGNHHDVHGGGHFSGRLTAPLVFAGAVAKQIIAVQGAEVCGRVSRLAGIDDPASPGIYKNSTAWAGLRQKPVAAFDDGAAERMRQAILAAKAEGDSVGGCIEAVAFGLPAGLGSPFFDNVESRLASFLFAIPAVKAVSFGAGFAIADLMGSEANDAFLWDDGRVKTATNHNGGLGGGITNAMPLVVNVALKPTPSIAKPQRSVNLKTGQNEELRVKGRHDPCVVQRALPVVEAGVALTILDLMVEAGKL